MDKQSYIIDFNNGFTDKIENYTLDRVKDIADKEVAYTQRDIHILDVNNAKVAMRTWFGVDIKNDKEALGEDVDNCIIFGTCGYFGPWVNLQ